MVFIPWLTIAESYGKGKGSRKRKEQEANKFWRPREERIKRGRRLKTMRKEEQ